MKKIIWLLSILLTSPILMSCSNSTTKTNDEKIHILTTFPPLYSFTTNITKDKAIIDNLVPAGASIHTWTPKPSDIKKISQADIIITNWVWLEGFINDLIKTSGKQNLIVIDSSKWVSPIEYNTTNKLEFEEEHHEWEKEHHHWEWTNPHIWLSIDNAIVQTTNILNTLSSLDNENQIFYQENANKYINKLKTLKQTNIEKFKNSNKKDFIVFHDAYQYFLNEYWIWNYQKWVIQEFPDKEPTQKQLQNLIKYIEQNWVKIIFSEPQFSPKIVEILQEKLWIKTYPIDPIWNELSENWYEKNISNLTDSFINAFSN